MLRVESEPSKIVSFSLLMGIYIGSIYLESNIFYKTTYININHSNVSTSRNIVLRKKS